MRMEHIDDKFLNSLSMTQYDHLMTCYLTGQIGPKATSHTNYLLHQILCLLPRLASDKNKDNTLRPHELYPDVFDPPPEIQQQSVLARFIKKENQDG